MNKLRNIFIFSFGVIVGSVTTWRCIKNYYEQLAQEDIDSVKEAYSNKPQIQMCDIDKGFIEEPDTSTVYKVEDKPDIFEYAEILEKKGYVANKSSHLKKNKSYVISPNEFGEFEEYNQISLTYYADQILADENGEIIEDVDGVIGMESLTHFGEYEDDSVFVRNDILKCDYEILMDDKNYSDILKQKPHQKEV